MKVICYIATILLMLKPLGIEAQQSFRVVSYNVENLFDMRHDTLKNDFEFLPDGSYHWTPTRYWKKMRELAQVLVATGEDAGMPVLVGLCEVENDTVLNDLTRRSVLRTLHYDYVMTDSPDRRGIDVALLYQPYLFQLIEWHAVRVPSIGNGFPPTRDQLYVKGLLVSGDTVHLVVCHLPSKAGGGRSSTKHRELAVSTLRQVVDSVLQERPDAKFLVMGDFNAGVGEKVFRRLLPPLRETLPLSRRERLQPRGTYYYQQQWSYLDHILVSEGLFAWQEEQLQRAVDQGVRVTSTCSSREFRMPFLLNDKGTPRRTFRGPVYNGGVSDHLPLLMDLWMGY